MSNTKQHIVEGVVDKAVELLEVWQGDYENLRQVIFEEGFVGNLPTIVESSGQMEAAREFSYLIRRMEKEPTEENVIAFYNKITEKIRAYKPRKIFKEVGESYLEALEELDGLFN